MNKPIVELYLCANCKHIESEMPNMRLCPECGLGAVIAVEFVPITELDKLNDRIIRLERIQKAALQFWNSFQELGKALEK